MTNISITPSQPVPGQNEILTVIFEQCHQAEDLLAALQGSTREGVAELNAEFEILNGDVDKLIYSQHSDGTSTAVDAAAILQKLATVSSQAQAHAVQRIADLEESLDVSDAATTELEKQLEALKNGVTSGIAPALDAVRAAAEHLTTLVKELESILA